MKRVSPLEERLAEQMRIVGLPEPEREFKFHDTRRWRFDFCWPDQKLAVEAEGGTWISGAHSRGKHFEKDAEKYNEAALLGWVVLRFTTDMIADGRALEYIRRALEIP
jgi:very-short-patch-repair endonuclease